MKAILNAEPINPYLFFEYGYTIPALLPIAGKPFIEKQIKTFKNEQNIYCFISKNIPQVENIRNLLTNIYELNVITIESTSILETIKIVLDLAREKNEPVEIIFGDTYSDKILPNDTIAVSEMSGSLRWSKFSAKNNLGSRWIPKHESSGEMAIIGKMRFGDPSKALNCLKSLAAEKIDIADFLNEYETQFGALGVLVDDRWHDLGHPDTLNRTREEFLHSRVFNQISTQKDSKNLKKYSEEKSEKISSEIAWYQYIENLNLNIAPKLVSFSTKENYYELDFLNGPNVSEIFLYAIQEEGYWITFLESLQQWLEKLSSIKSPELITFDENYDMFVEKTKRRIELLFKQKNFIKQINSYDRKLLPFLKLNVNQALLFQEKYTSLIFKSLKINSKLIHGDPVFSNIFFDFQKKLIISIDPRGDWSGKGLFGNPLYDIVKLSQSMLGLYDVVSSDLFQNALTKHSGDKYSFIPLNYQQTQPIFENFLMNNSLTYNLNLEQIRLLESCLWFSLAALHYESPARQLEAINRALKILNLCGFKELDY